jgi:hypothetical protein
MKCLVVLIALAAAPACGAEVLSPQETVKEFYTREIHGPYSSDQRLLGNVRHLLSKELDSLLSATDNYQLACTKLVPPDVKPWILDSDPWYYYSADGARSIDGTTLLAQRGSAARVAAQLRYDAELKWTDTVTLNKDGDSWRIANISFEQGGSLIKSLHSYIKYSCASG